MTWREVTVVFKGMGLMTTSFSVLCVVVVLSCGSSGEEEVKGWSRGLADVLRAFFFRGKIFLGFADRGFGKTFEPLSLLPCGVVTTHQSGFLLFLLPPPSAPPLLLNFPGSNYSS